MPSGRPKSRVSTSSASSSSNRKQSSSNDDGNDRSRVSSSSSGSKGVGSKKKSSIKRGGSLRPYASILVADVFDQLIEDRVPGIKKNQKTVLHVKL
jgi:hypothetical protein